MPHVSYMVNILDDKNRPIILVLLFLLALIVRLAAFILFHEAGGDGPTRAVQAYIWSESPRIFMHGTWLPGFKYLSGAFNFVIKNPVVSTRTLNLILGALTVPLFYLLVRKVYDHYTGLLSASTLACFPLHIGLSVTSLTEVSFLFEVIAGTFFLILASESPMKKRVPFLGLSLSFLCLAMMTRYESWILIPIFPSYYFWKTGSISESILLLLILLIFPFTWMLGSYFEHGHVLPMWKGIPVKRGGGLHSVHSIKLYKVKKILGIFPRNYLGWILLVTIAWGLLLELSEAARKKINTEKTLYILVTVVSGLFILIFTIYRGWTKTPRYFLFSFVMVLPFAAVTLKRYLGAYFSLIMVFVILAITSPAVSYILYKPNLYITRVQPQEFRNLARWLKNSRYKDCGILLTKMRWKATYLPLYFPDIGLRYKIVSRWHLDSDLLNFLTGQRPCLLITCEEDVKDMLRVERLLKREIREERLIHTEGTLKVYNLLGLVNPEVYQSEKRRGGITRSYRLGFLGIDCSI